MDIYPIIPAKTKTVTEARGEASNDISFSQLSLIDSTQEEVLEILTKPAEIKIQLGQIDKFLAHFPEPEYPLILGIENMQLLRLEKEILKLDKKSIYINQKYAVSLCLELRRKLKLLKR